MNYVGAILGYLSWPFMIWISFVLVRWALRYFHKQAGKEASTEK